jgi:hypothetical protein
MAWALGIAFENGNFVAELVDAGGSVMFVPPYKLATVGTVSDCHQSRRKAVVTRFSDWTPKSSAEYLTGLGVTVPEGASCRHTVFEFQVRQTRFLVPALAVMRALFRPNKFLLPTMFLPQALDRVAFIDYSAPASPTLVVDASWAQAGSRFMTQQIHDTLVWMFSAPSARIMAGSVHTAALAGRIDLLLPVGESWLTVRGAKIDDTYFVSEIGISYLKTTEPVGLTENASTGRLDFLTTTACKGRAGFVPAHADGTIDVTDEEWDVISPILLAGMSTHRLKLNQRDIFNGILTKLNTGLPWRKVSYTLGSVTHAIYAYRSWGRQGTLPPALAILIELRSPRKIIASE